jgi:hypothetical protein
VPGQPVELFRRRLAQDEPFEIDDVGTVGGTCHGYPPRAQGPVQVKAYREGILGMGSI